MALEFTSSHFIINAIPVTCIGEPIQRSNMMLACDCFDNFSDTYTTTRVIGSC